MVVFVDHFSWWRFSPGQVIEEHRVGQATGHAFNTEGMVVRRLPDDFFRHRILGLGPLGLGTGDFIVKPPYEDSFEIHNVWRANSKQRLMETMIALAWWSRPSRAECGWGIAARNDGLPLGGRWQRGDNAGLQPSRMLHREGNR